MMWCVSEWCAEGGVEEGKRGGEGWGDRKRAAPTRLGGVVGARHADEIDRRPPRRSGRHPRRLPRRGCTENGKCLRSLESGFVRIACFMMTRKSQVVIEPESVSGR